MTFNYRGTRNFISAYIILLSCCSMQFMHAFKVLHGNTTQGSMTFAIGAHAFNYGAGRLLIGAQNNIEGVGSNFSIAMSDHGSAFEALMPETIILNNKADQINPAHGKAVALLHAPHRGQSLPVFTLKEDPQTLYMLESILALNTFDKKLHKFPILISKQIFDANGKVGDIHAIASAQIGEQFLLFVAVSPAGQPFGVVGSGIAMLQLITWQNPYEVTIWPQVSGADIVYSGQQNIRQVDLVVKKMVKNKAAATKQKKESSESSSDSKEADDIDEDLSWVFEGGMHFIMSKDSASTLYPGIDMHWDPLLNRLFIALQAQAGPNEQAKICALIVGQLKLDPQKNYGLSFSSIIPLEAITTPDLIVAAQGAQQSVSIYKVRTLMTTTGLNYVVVAGGNGEPDAVGNCIYALPLINDNKNNITNGMLADVVQEPEATFNHSYPFSFSHRGFVETRKKENEDTLTMQLFTNRDRAAMVGGGQLPMAAHERVTDLFTQGDAVYVTIGNEYSQTTQPGMFYSQALFDPQGRVQCWTPWKRTSGVTKPLFGGAMDIANGSLWILGGPDQNVIGYTLWSDGAKDFLLGGSDAGPQDGFVSLVSEHIPVSQGGVLALEDFPVNTPSFGADAATPLNQLSLQVLTGNRVIMLVETARNEQPFVCTANTGDFATGMQVMNDGTLAGFKHDNATKVLVMRGGVLDQLGPINYAAISRCPLAQGTARGFLFVGGVGGVAVLSRPDNGGWDTSPDQGLHAAFNGLTPDMTFKIIGNYHFVQKLFCDDTYLYVLTNDTFDRIPFEDLNSPPYTIANVASVGYARIRFFDVALSGSYALLATSKGLYESEFDVRSSQAASWHKVELPEGDGAVTYLYQLSSDKSEQKGIPLDNVYLINKQTNTDVTRVYRCAFTQNNGKISLESITNQFVKTIPSYFLQYNSHRNFVGTEGGYFYSSMVDHKKNKRNGDQEIMLSYPQILLNLQPGFRFMESAKRTVQATSVTEVSNARLLKRSSASGALLLISKMGLTIHE